jgi:methylmalonyl-CoA mutase
MFEGISCIDLARATDREEKESQLNRLKRRFQKRHAERGAGEALERLQQVALSGDNIFAELMETVKCCSLGQITEALYEVGGKYRRNM